jgi:hypothetical protein
MCPRRPIVLAIRRYPRPLLIVFALLVALALAVPLVGAKGGNSDSAKACQKGGWEQLATAESPSIPFATQDACVAYGATGGVSVKVVAAPIAHTEFTDPAGGGGYWTCDLRGWLTGDTTGIVSVSMEVWFTVRAEDDTVVTVAIPLELSPPEFDALAGREAFGLVQPPDSVTAEATYIDGSVRALETSVPPVACGLVDVP